MNIKNKYITLVVSFNKKNSHSNVHHGTAPIMLSVFAIIISYLSHRGLCHGQTNLNKSLTIMTICSKLAQSQETFTGGFNLSFLNVLFLTRTSLYANMKCIKEIDDDWMDK